MLLEAMNKTFDQSENASHAGRTHMESVPMGEHPKKVLANHQ
jgi:hypothetical protein